jgi:hypothetical protein
VGAETSDHRTNLNVRADLERGPEYAVARRMDESGHKLARQRSVPAEELASETLIALTSDALIQERITRLFKKPRDQTRAPLPDDLLTDSDDMKPLPGP